PRPPPRAPPACSARVATPGRGAPPTSHAPSRRCASRSAISPPAATTGERSLVCRPRNSLNCGANSRRPDRCPAWGGVDADRSPRPTAVGRGSVCASGASLRRLGDPAHPPVASGRPCQLAGRGSCAGQSARTVGGGLQPPPPVPANDSHVATARGAVRAPPSPAAALGLGVHPRSHHPLGAKEVLADPRDVPRTPPQRSGCLGTSRRRRPRPLGHDPLHGGGRRGAFTRGQRTGRAPPAGRLRSRLRPDQGDWPVPGYAGGGGRPACGDRYLRRDASPGLLGQGGVGARPAL